MVNYKSKYLSKNDNHLSAYILMGIFIMTLVFFVSFLMYNALKSDVGYRDFNHISEFSEITNQNHQEYYVYYYSENFNDCKILENDILAFAEANPNNDILYFAKAGSIDGVNTINGLNSAPTLLLIRNGVVISMDTNVDSILVIIEQTE
ncbi:MAG: hypothetical protein QM489_04560 [Candidatus Izemoplasma sp.]